MMTLQEIKNDNDEKNRSSSKNAIFIVFPTSRKQVRMQLLTS